MNVWLVMAAVGTTVTTPPEVSVVPVKKDTNWVTMDSPVSVRTFSFDVVV